MSAPWERACIDTGDCDHCADPRFCDCACHRDEAVELPPITPGHPFVRAGQVRADLPPRDFCVRCGASEAAHAALCNAISMPTGYGCTALSGHAGDHEWPPAARQPAGIPKAHIGAELAAGVSAARAMLGDFQNVMHEFTTGTSPDVDFLTWALRLSQHLAQLVDAIGDGR